MRTFGFLLGPPLLAALLALVTVPFRQTVGWANAALSLVSLGAAVALGHQVLADGAVVAGWQDLLRADALSALLAACVSVVTVLAAWLGPGLDRSDEPRRARRFQIFANLFAFTMLSAVTTNNVGLMWVAIEATTHHVRHAGRARRHQGVRRGLLEVRAAGVGGHRPRLRRHRARVLRFRAAGRSAGGGPELDRAQNGRARASPRGHGAGVRVHPGGLRHEGGTGADAHVAARRPRRGARAALRDDVGRAARGRALRHRALEGGGERRRRAARSRTGSSSSWAYCRSRSPHSVW